LLSERVSAGFLETGFLETHLVTVLSGKASVTQSSNAGFLAGLLPWFLESRVSGKPSGHRGFRESPSNPLQ